MKCYYHPNVEAVATCSHCGKAICQTDAVFINEKTVCQQCVSTGNFTSNAVSLPSKPSNSLAMISLALAVMGLVGCFCCGVSGSILGIPAAITGFIARKQIIASQGDEQGLQIATIATIIGIGEFILGMIVLCLVVVLYASGAFTDILQQL